MVELKNGDTYNGKLVNCDSWMNINLKDVIRTSRVKYSIYIVTYCCICCTFLVVPLEYPCTNVC